MDSVDGGKQLHSLALAPGRGDEFMDISPLPPLPTVDYAPPVPPLPPLPAPAYPVVDHTESTACAVDDVLVEEALALVEEASSDSEGAPPQPPAASGPNDRDTAFDKRLEELRAYREAHGHLRISKKERSLSNFCSNARRARNNPGRGRLKLTEDRIASLDALGFTWEPKAGSGGNRRASRKTTDFGLEVDDRKRDGTTSFQERIEKLRAYKEKHGHTDVSKGEKSEDPSLGRFCAQVRYSRNNPEKASVPLSKDRIAALDELGFRWTVQKGKGPGKSFSDHMVDLQAYHRANGHINVKASENAKLATFCYRVRKARKRPGKGGIKLSEDRIASLDALGFTWETKARKGSKRRSVDDRAGTASGDVEAETTKAKPAILKRMACGDCAGCKRKACKQCDACTGSPKKRCIQRLCTQKVWVDGAEYAAWKASGKTTAKPLSQPAVKPAAKSFQERLEELRAYKDAQGHLNVDRTDRPKLWRFCCAMRASRKCTQLSEDRIQALDALGFQWGLTHGEMFSGRLDELRAFKAEHGHLRIPGKQKSLATFCHRVRRARSDPERAAIKLTEDRIAALDEMGFCWDIDARKSGKQGNARKSFAERVEELKAYKEKHGHLNVSKEEDSSLFHFTNNVRYGRSNPGKGMAITEDRVATLDELGFPWKRSNGGFEGRQNDQSFTQRIEDLKAYKSEHGHLDVKQKENASLHHFCYNIRYARANPGKGMTITEDRVAALDAIGFQWSRIGTSSGKKVRKSFSERVEELAAYKERHGHLNVSKEEDQSLFHFVRHARNARLQMTEDRVATLDKLGFQWSCKDEGGTRNYRSFAQRIEDLKAYMSEHGHLDVELKENPSLRHFCNNIRYARANPDKGGMTITEDRVAALDAIGFPWTRSKSFLGRESATNPDSDKLKRIACGDCEGCNRKACKECDACTGSPKKRCPRRFCTNELWVDKSEYAAWKASGKSGPRPSPKEREGPGQSNKNGDATAAREVEAAVPLPKEKETGVRMEVKCNELFSPLKRREERNNVTERGLAVREDIMQLPNDKEPSVAPGQEMATDLTEDHTDTSDVPAFLLGGHETMNFSV